ncbi:DUF1178 family protein [Roseibium alexandrii]|uniref:DUF1178 family protein n=1 Tax=Roseibium alexandrii (strain DSM 17067 / NCIMB 14079 / DFL-11) TaxID=244592 RepID=A0A5E8H163_ROSAD|nr:DUF1178 family protein [Roseibium alexandrii]EEE45571.1 Uncharacterized protein SADFL11_2860 [Roseibium alexandrii DFL-11]
MIKYTLVCDTPHTFEGWFRNSEDFEVQCGRGLVTCPVCNSTDIKKGLMAPAVSTSRKKDAMVVPQMPSADVIETQSAPEPAPAKPESGKSQVSALLPNDVRQKEIVEALRLVRAKMTENSENVGTKFASEARKIHYGESEERNIYGETSPKEAMDLIDEGISVLPLPELPDEKN